MLRNASISEPGDLFLSDLTSDMPRAHVTGCCIDWTAACQIQLADVQSRAGSGPRAPSRPDLRRKTLNRRSQRNQRQEAMGKCSSDPLLPLRPPVQKSYSFFRSANSVPSQCHLLSLSHSDGLRRAQSTRRAWVRADFRDPGVPGFAQISRPAQKCDGCTKSC